MGSEIVILGAGFGGLEAAAGLSAELGDEHQITLIDQSDHFIIGFSKFEVAFGRQPAGQVKAYYRDLAIERVNFVQDRIEAIDLAQKRVRLQGATLGYDYLVIALGAELAPEATPGFVADGYQFYSLAGAEELYPVLEGFRTGTILLSIFGAPYKCPPAPYEAAFQLHDFFRDRGVRDQMQIKMLIPAPVPLPVAPGADVEVKRRFAERGIELLTQHKVTALDPVRKEALVAGRKPLAYDLFIGVPLHQPPQVVRDLNLSPGGWIPVNRENLRTVYEGVYAVGDVTTVPAGQGAVPKAGAFAEDGAKVVVSDLLYRITGRGEPHKFEAMGTCYLEFGDGEVAQIKGNFLGNETPQVALEQPSAGLREDKDRFKDERIQRWFRS